MSKKESQWQILEEHYYERFQIFSIKRSRRVNPRTNVWFDFFLIEGLDWASIIPITREGKVVLVRQYRHGINDWTLEFPGGVVEANEVDMTASAARELREETGYEAKNVELLGVLRPNPAMLSNHLHVCLARNVELVGQQNLDSGEDIQVVLKTIEELREMIASGKIQHAHVVAAFSLLEVSGKLKSS